MTAIRRSAFSMAAATAAGALLLLFSLPNVGPVVRAARADGVRGSFVAEQLNCVEHPGHQACSWSGTFRLHGETGVRADVYLYGSNRDMLRPGQQVPAVDIGRRAQVYPPNGSNEWVVTAVLLLAGCLLLMPLLRKSAQFLRAGRRPVRSSSPDGRVRS